MAVHLAVTGDVFDGVLFCVVLFPVEISWMRSGSEFSRFLRIFLPTLAPADNYLLSVPPCFPAAVVSDYH